MTNRQLAKELEAIEGPLYLVKGLRRPLVRKAFGYKTKTHFFYEYLPETPADRLAATKEAAAIGKRGREWSGIVLPFDSGQRAADYVRRFPAA